MGSQYHWGEENKIIQISIIIQMLEGDTWAGGISRCPLRLKPSCQCLLEIRLLQNRSERPNNLVNLLATSDAIPTVLPTPRGLVELKNIGSLDHAHTTSCACAQL